MTDTDPKGLSQHESGAKMDSGKQLPGMVIKGFAPGLKMVTAVGTYGCSKYTKFGFLDVEDGFERYYEAAMRHLQEFNQGLLTDPESGLTHIAHFAWNALAMATFYAKEHPEVLNEVSFWDENNLMGSLARIKNGVKPTKTILGDFPDTFFRGAVKGVQDCDS